jgi:hypothetical protein
LITLQRFGLIKLNPTSHHPRATIKRRKPMLCIKLCAQVNPTWST